MGLLNKHSYTAELMLPYRYIQPEEDIEAGAISIIAYGSVLGVPKTCYATYIMKKAVMYINGDYEELIDLLKDHEGREVKVLFKIKNEKAKDFKIDLSSFASLYHDDRFINLELVCWGLSDQ